MFHIPPASHSKLAAVRACVKPGWTPSLKGSSACPLPLQLHSHSFFSLLSHSLNFPRGKGPLKNSSDVINAAKKIAEAGSRMDKLARAVADQVALQLCLSLSFLASVWNCVWVCHRGWRQSKFWVRVSGHGHWKSLMWALTSPAGAMGCVAAWLCLPMGPTLREQDSRTKLCL